MIGSIRVRRKFKIGSRFIVISERSGTKDKRAVRHINTILDSLYSRGRLDILQHVADGVVGLMQLRSAFDSGQLDSLPSAQTIQPLKDHLYAWLKTYSIEDNTRAGYKTCFDQLFKHGPATPVVADLPVMLEQMREAYAKAGKARTYNQCRSATMAYVRSTLKRSNPLYLTVAAVEPLNGKPKRAGNPLSVAQVLELVEKLPDPIAGQFWTMCALGTNVKEYKGLWEVVGETVVIHGTKRKGRDRIIPKIVDTLTPAVGFHYMEFRAALRKASKRTVQPHDCRRTFARLIEEAGLWESHRDAYLGHGKTIRTLYSTPRVCEQMLASDRAKLVGYLKTETDKYYADRQQGIKVMA